MIMADSLLPWIESSNRSFDKGVIRECVSRVQSYITFPGPLFAPNLSRIGAMYRYPVVGVVVTLNSNKRTFHFPY